MKPISDEALDEFDKIHQKFKEFAEKELKGMDYRVIFSLSKTKGTEIESFAGIVSNLAGLTSWAIVKVHLGNIIQHAQKFLQEYQLVPMGKPLIEQKPNNAGLLSQTH